MLAKNHPCGWYSAATQLVIPSLDLPAPSLAMSIFHAFKCVARNSEPPERILLRAPLFNLALILLEFLLTPPVLGPLNWPYLSPNKPCRLCVYKHRNGLVTRIVTCWFEFKILLTKRKNPSSCRWTKMLEHISEEDCAIKGKYSDFLHIYPSGTLIWTEAVPFLQEFLHSSTHYLPTPHLSSSG